MQRFVVRRWLLALGLTAAVWGGAAGASTLPTGTAGVGGPVDPMASMTPARFVATVSHLAEHPLDKDTLAVRPQLFRWIEASPDVEIGFRLCSGIQPWVAQASTDPIAQILFSQYTLESASYQIAAPDASIDAREVEAMKATLRMYLLVQAKKGDNAYADRILDDIKTHGPDVLKRYACVATAQEAAQAKTAAPLAPATPHGLTGGH